jgi:hypothetical protein
MNYDNFIIFLDIDGVICSYNDMGDYEAGGEHKFRKASVKALNKIIKYYNADLCMISSWNNKFKDEEHYKSFLISRGIRVNNLYLGDDTDRYEFVQEEIKKGLKYYLIIDDEGYGYYYNSIVEYKRILQPNRYRCIDNHDFNHVTKNWTLNI